MKKVYANVRVGRGFIRQVFMPRQYRNDTPRKVVVQDARAQLDVETPAWKSAELVVMYYDKDSYHFKDESIEIKKIEP